MLEPVAGLGKVLLVSSTGGVLLDLLALEPWWSRHASVWAAVRGPDTEQALAGQRVHWIRDVSFLRLSAVAHSMLQAWRILRIERPDLVVSAGSAPALPFFILGRLSGVPTFWISTLNVLTTPGLSGRIAGRLASRVFLQRPASRLRFPHGVEIGELY
jgi:hypothetical protein